MGRHGRRLIGSSNGYGPHTLFPIVTPSITIALVTDCAIVAPPLAIALDTLIHLRGRLDRLIALAVDRFSSP